MTLVSPSYDAAYAYLAGDVERNLALLSALEYDAVATLHGLARGAALAALALALEPQGPPTRRRAAVLLAADDAAALAALLGGVAWPAPAVFSVQQRALLPAVAAFTGRPHAPAQGLLHYITATVPDRPHALARRLCQADSDLLDLTPCGLSPVALRSWLRRGWRAFGVVQGRALLAHALAAYPLGDTEEVSAVFTAPRSRRQGLASAVVTATIANIVGRGRRAVYVSKKANTASQRVALGLGLRLALETWETEG